jgi:hypothetical protein
MKILQTIKEYNDKKKEIIADFKENFFQELFDKYENLQFIPILSYTPYFNDGEPCTRRTYYLLDDLTWGMQALANNFDDNQVLELIATPKELFATETEDEYDEDILLEYLQDEAIDDKTILVHSINNKLTKEEIKEIETLLESVSEFIEEQLDDHTINLVKRQGKDVLNISTEYEHD